MAQQKGGRIQPPDFLPDCNGTTCCRCTNRITERAVLQVSRRQRPEREGVMRNAGPTRHPLGTRGPGLTASTPRGPRFPDRARSVWKSEIPAARLRGEWSRVRRSGSFGRVRPVLPDAPRFHHPFAKKRTTHTEDRKTAPDTRPFLLRGLRHPAERQQRRGTAPRGACGSQDNGKGRPDTVRLLPRTGHSRTGSHRCIAS